MTPFDRHIQAARGFLELGMPLEANDELEEIEPAMKLQSEVLIIRVEIYRTLEKWELMETVARRLSVYQQDEPQWVIDRAYATRRAFSIEDTRIILLDGLKHFRECATIHFNLACYEAQLGHLVEARLYLVRAIELEPVFRRFAREDEDLEPLRSVH